MDYFLTVDRHDAAHETAQLLVERGQISEAQYHTALRLAAEWGSDIGEVLIGEGMVIALTWYTALANHLHLPFINLRTEAPDTTLWHAEDRQDYIDLGVVPWSQENDFTVLATISITPRLHDWAIARYGENRYWFVITSKFDILWTVQQHFEIFDDRDAREGLWAAHPEHSAKQVLASRQVIAVYVLLSALLLGMWAAPHATIIVGALLISMAYLCTFALKFILTWIGADRRIDVQVTDAEVAALADSDLPIYTILVPMYREAEVLPLLVRAMRRLDYPHSKLDIKLVLEAGDEETIEAAKALGAASTFEIIRVPPSQPKTKPKACNYALRFARGEYLAIFDAEDQPEPDQLKKAIAAFRKSPANIACIQCRLNYFNRDDNLLTRMFTLEYSQWFDFLLPGLDALNIPIPLGGTSNHFDLKVLRRLGAWDPYNVTEDADLGVRLTQEGYRVGIVNSTTYEEANGRYLSWIKQRSRWIKGYMQTYLVHMRHPLALYRSLGHTGFWGFQFFIGGPPLTMLINPLLWLMFVVSLFFDPQTLAAYFPPLLLYIALFNLLVANLMYIYFGIVAAFKRRYFDLVPFGLLQPFYWIMHSLAAYKALSQLIFSPHYWEKTQHGTSAATQRALANVH